MKVYIKAKFTGRKGIRKVLRLTRGHKRIKFNRQNISGLAFNKGLERIFFIPFMNFLK